MFARVKPTQELKREVACATGGRAGGMEQPKAVGAQMSPSGVLDGRHGVAEFGACSVGFLSCFGPFFYCYAFIPPMYNGTAY